MAKNLGTLAQQHNLKNFLSYDFKGELQQALDLGTDKPWYYDHVIPIGFMIENGDESESNGSKEYSLADYKIDRERKTIDMKLYRYNTVLPEYGVTSIVTRLRIDNLNI